MSRSLGVLFLATTVAACGFDGGEAAEDVTEITQPILNGSETFGASLAWMRLRTARLELPPPRGCSGTVLDAYTILTARHCVTTTGTPFGEILSRLEVQVKVDGGSLRPIQSIVPMEPTGQVQHDVALIFLSAGNMLRDAQSRPIFTPIEVNAPSYLVGGTIRVSGWGYNTTTGGAGTLRHGTLVVDDDVVSPFPNDARLLDGILLRTNASNQRQMAQDSGSPYWGSAASNGTVPIGIIGIHSRDGSGSNTELGTRAHAIRSWARAQMSAHHGFGAGHGYLRHFQFGNDLSAGTRYAPGGAPLSWSESGGYLFQNSNVGPTHVVWDYNNPVRDFTASVEIYSPGDDDGAGIVFHHVDQNNYYYCEAGDQHNELAIRSRINGTISTLTSTTWNGTFASPKTMRVASADFLYQCQFDGLTVAALNKRMPVGSVGVFQDHNNGVRFDNLDVLGGY